MNVKSLFYILGALFISLSSLAKEAPVVGRKAAAQYFQKAEPTNTTVYGGASDRYLALHAGRYMGTQSYEWGKNGQEDDVGGNTFGVTYRVGEWQRSMDLNLRIDYAEYTL